MTGRHKQHDGAPRGERTGRGRGLLLAAGMFVALLGASPRPATAQAANPVYLDDSPAAEGGLVRARELASGGNLAEAVRVLQRLLDEEGERVTTSGTGDKDLHRSVREAVHATLRGNPALLARYRETSGPVAQRMLEQGADADTERTMLLTPAGFDAAIRVARRRLERAQFWSAWQTLAQLDAHPDRAGDRQQRFAALALEVARYLNSPRAASAAAAWADVPGDALAPVEGPAMITASTPLLPAPPIDLEGLLSKPLWSESVATPEPGSETGVDPLAQLPATPGEQKEPPSPASMLLRIEPTVAGETIYVNTGEELSAWDRLTLSPRWSRKRFADMGDDHVRNLGAGARFSGLQDTASVAVSGSTVVFTTGLARQGRREGDARVHAVDAATGADLWSVDIAALDATLTEAWVRGPAMIDQGVVVVAASKQSNQRRLNSVALLGLDLSTGRVLWKRTVGSAGVAPYGQPTEAPDTTAIFQGVAYRADRVGVVSAIETVSGRVRWERRVQPETLGNRESAPWESAGPLVHAADETLVTLSPDRRRVLAIDLDAGTIRGEVMAQRLGTPEYLLLSGDTLVGVGQESVFAAVLPLPESAPKVAKPAGDAEPLPDIAWRVLRVAAKPNIRGRVVIAGDRVLAPVSDGLVVSALRPGPDAAPKKLLLDRPGAVLPLRDQLIVVDDLQVHTYLLWDVAEKMLADRIEADSSDPTPAVTYAELAHRAGKPEAILPAADRAIAAIARSPEEARSEVARKRLFRSALAMVEPVLVVDAAEGDLLAAARRAETPMPMAMPTLPEAIAAGVIERLPALASDAEERVASLLAAGMFAESRNRPGKAIEAYQAILTDDALAQTAVSRRGVAGRADLEATRRLRAAVRTHGPAAYAAFEAEAQRILAGGASANAGARQWAGDAASFEDLAARYPVSAAAAKAMLRAADLHEQAGRLSLAVRALEAGLLAAEDSLTTDAALIGELSGRLVRTLERSGQVAAAAQALRRLTAQRPSLAMTDRGATIDPAALAASLERDLAALLRRPRIGPVRADAQPQVLAGWSLFDPVTTNLAGPPPAHVMMQHVTGELSMFAPAENAPGLTQLWTLPSSAWTKVVRVDSDAVYLSAEATPPGQAQPAAPRLRAASPAGGRTVARLDARTGKTLWTTPPFRSLFSADANRLDPRLGRSASGATVLVFTPAGARPIVELLAVFDQRTLALVERSGRAAGFDLDTGKTLWTLEASAPRVHDVWADGGVLAIGGSELPPADRDDRVAGPPVVVAVDIRTGRPLLRERQPLGQVRWVRVSPAGRVYTGMDAGIVCSDAALGQTRWRISTGPARQSADSWALPDRLIVLDDGGSFWQYAEDDGRLRPEPLDMRGRSHKPGLTFRAVGDRAFCIGSGGVLAFDRSGAVVGRDARATAGDILPPVLGDGVIFAIDTSPSVVGAAPIFTARCYDFATLALTGKAGVALGADPGMCVAVDGKIIISAGDVTAVLEAPAPPPAQDRPAPPEQPRREPAADAEKPAEKPE